MPPQMNKVGPIEQRHLGKIGLAGILHLACTSRIYGDGHALLCVLYDPQALCFPPPLIMPSKVSFVKQQVQNSQAAWLCLGGRYPYRCNSAHRLPRFITTEIAVKSQILELCYCYYIESKVMLGTFILISCSQLTFLLVLRLVQIQVSQPSIKNTTFNIPLYPSLGDEFGMEIRLYSLHSPLFTKA